MLKLERVRRGYTQEQLAEISKVGRITISKIEKKGIDNVQAHVLKKLAAALDMSVSELFFED